MMRRITGGALVALAAFMVIGFVRADVAGSPLVIGLTLLVAVGVPGAAGLYLLVGHRGRAASGERLAALRVQTIEAEVLRLATSSSGRLAAVEVVRDLGISPEEASSALEALMRRGLADVEVTPSGGIVYAFPDIQLLAEKPRARGVLDD
ncbi:MAG: hypothetical protein ACREKM_05410 [Longimicrobiales bacterium]